MLLPLFSNAQNVYFKNYDISDGLPSNTIMCSIQDKRGFVWLGTKDGICRFDGRSFKLFGDEDETQGVMNGLTQSLCEDSLGKIWFSTANGLGYYDPETGEVTRLGGNETAMRRLLCDSDGNIWSLDEGDFVCYSKKYEKSVLDVDFTMQNACTDSKGELWVVTTDGKLKHFNKPRQDFETITIPGHKAVNITDAGDRHFIISTAENQIISFEYATRQVEVLIDKDLRGNTINCILARTEDEYWISCIQGLYIYRYGEGIIDFIDDEGQHSLQDTNVISMSLDREGNIWLGTFHTGISLWHNRSDSVSKFVESNSQNALMGHLVHAIGEDRYDNIWVGTEDGGMTVFHIDSKTSHYLGTNAGFPESLNFHSMISRGDYMWISTFNDGIYIVDAKKEKVVKHYDVGSNYCGYIYSTPDGTIYVGARNGLFKYDPATDSFNEVPGLSSCWVHCIYEDSFGKLWIATYGQGLYTIEGNMMQHITTETPNAKLPSNYTTSFCEGRDGTLWITTEGGGLCYTKLGKEPVFKHFARKEGLTSNVACAVMEDSDGILWVSTTKGLVELDPKTMDIINVYEDNNGTIGNNFSYASCYVTNKEVVHMGTIKGLLVFEPALLKKNDKDVPLYIVDIQSGERDSVRQLHSKGRSALMSDKITVPSKDASYLSISFSSPDYSEIHRHSFEYSFKRGNRGISNETTDNTVVLSNIHPGKYKFTVKIAGSTAPQSTKTLSFRIKPPFYASLLAKIFYALLAAALVITLGLSVKRKRSSEEQHQHEIMEAEKQKELAEAKVNFFTNITHEVRTPLTLIKLPIEKIISEKQYTEESKDDIMTIQSNTNRLLNLTNQLLDIRNIEQRNFKLKISHFDICESIRKTAALFTPGIKERHMESSIEIPERSIFVDSDLDFIEKIVCNLMSNAVKYGESKVALKLEEDKVQRCIRILVDSNGDKISDSEAEKIFEQFYQIRMVNSQLVGSNGTGLGLPYARQLAQALNGKLFLDTQRQDCNSFIFEFPAITSEEDVEDVHATAVKAVDEEEKTADSDSNRHWLLVVEDSAEMNKYLCKELEKDYNILSASNGEEALDVIHNNRVDIVVSDIMMPVMDGCELCNNIKKDVEFSHIPVILLTAAVGVDTRIHTLEVGADGYIEKPFSIELLKANIDNLFKNREIAYNQFANSPLSHFKSLVVNNIDQDFMDKLHSVIMDNIADQELSIDTLTQLMCTSKSTLYRKVKANTGANINEYIRICKLKKAAEMLTSQKYRINEVAYLTGFSSPSYFTTCFQKQFKISPSNFVKNLTK